MMTRDKSDIAKPFDKEFGDQLQATIKQAFHENTSLDMKNLVDTISHYGLILSTDAGHELVVHHQEIAKVIYHTIETEHKGQLGPHPQNAPIYIAKDNSYRIRIRDDLYEELTNHPAIDPRIVLISPSAQQSSKIIGECERRLKRIQDKGIELYNNKEQLFDDLVKHGMFGITSSGDLRVYFPDSDQVDKIYNGLFIHAPELFNDRNFGANISRYYAGNTPVRGFDLDVNKAQDVLKTCNLEKVQVLNGGDLIADDKTSISIALSSYINDQIKPAGEAHKKAVELLLEPMDKKKAQLQENIEPLSLEEFKAMFAPPVVAKIGAIDTSHLYTEDQRLKLSGLDSSEELGTLFSAPSNTKIVANDDHSKEPPKKQEALVKKAPELTPTAAAVIGITSAVAGIEKTNGHAKLIKTDGNSHVAPQENKVTESTTPSKARIEIKADGYEKDSPKYKLPIRTDNKYKSDQSYNEYAESTAFRLMIRREEAGLSREELASIIIRQMTSQKVRVTDQQIKHWEQGRGDLPDKYTLEHLISVLIEKNEAVQNKNEAKEQMLLAYEADGERYIFADILHGLREKLASNGIIPTREEVADMIAKSINSVSPYELELLSRDGANYIAAIEAGAIQPSKAIDHVIAKSISECKIKPDRESYSIV